MADPIITTGGADTWVNSADTSANYGDTSRLHLASGLREVLVRPPLPNILGRTVTSATLYAHAAMPLVAQTLTYGPTEDHWTQRATWANAPDVIAGESVAVLIGATAVDALVAFPVTDHLQAVADGTYEYHGWRISTNSSAAQQWLRSSQSGDPAWELHVTLAEDAEEPANLRPDGGGAVGTSEPILAWEFDDQAQYQVQVDTPALGVDPDEVTPDYDSGWITHPDPEHNLAAAVYTPPASPPGPTSWRVRVVDTDGNESPWSPWADFTVTALPTLVVDAPTGLVGDPAVTVLAHLSTGTVSSWVVWATGPDRSDVRWRSGVQSDPTIAVQIPLRNQDKRRIFTETKGGWIYLRAHDSVDRTIAVGEQTFVDTWIEVEFTEDGALVAPTNLTVMQVGDDSPFLTWYWQITDVPDSFNIIVDGETVEKVDAADLTPAAGLYSWTDSGQVAPLRPHTLAVRAVNGGAVSTRATRQLTHEVKGVWLIPDADVDPIWLAGTAVGGFTQSDRRATYTPVVGPPVDIVYDWEGFAGTFEGVVDSQQEDVWAAIDAVEALRTSRNRLARLVWGSQSILVRVRDLHYTSSDNIDGRNLEHVVRFSFVQVGD